MCGRRIRRSSSHHRGLRRRRAAVGSPQHQKRYGQLQGLGRPAKGFGRRLATWGRWDWRGERSGDLEDQRGVSPLKTGRLSLRQVPIWRLIVNI